MSSSSRTPLFQPVDSRRNLEHVVREMRAAIARGDLKPGQKLPAEPELAVQFNVSRSALREALKALELSGYLEVRRGYGGGTFVAAGEVEEFTTVRPPSVPWMAVSPRQLMQVRLAIEPLAARLAASTPVDGTLALREAVQNLDPSEQRVAHLLAATVQFHIALAQLTANPVFVVVLETLRPVMYRAMNSSVQSAPWRAACREEHERILAEVEAGNAEHAEALMRSHLFTEASVD